jgi:predicted DNA-binding protein
MLGYFKLPDAVNLVVLSMIINLLLTYAINIHIIKSYIRGEAMRTTLNIPDELIKELHRFSDEKSKTKAISIAIEDYVRRKKIEHLLSLSGNITVDYDWAKEEEKEIELEEKETTRE